MPDQHSVRGLLSTALVGGLMFGALPAGAQEAKPAEPPAANAPAAPPPAATPAPTAAPAPEPAVAAPAPAAAPAPVAEPHPAPAHGSAYGMVLEVRLPVGETFVRSFQGPERAQDTTHAAQLAGPRGVYDVPFVNSTYYVFNGFRLPSFTVGLGFGFHHFSWEVDTPCIDPNTGQKFQCRGIPPVVSDGTIFQFAPAIQLPYFTSADGKAEGYATAAFVFTWGPNITPQYDPYDPTSGSGNYVEPDINAVAIGLGGSLGLGGRYFLHPNFALGVESGIFYNHLTVTATATYTDPITGQVHSLDAVPDQKGWFLGGYGALTAMFVVGQ